MKGLTNEEVINNRKKYGSNKICKNQKESFIKKLVSTLGDPIIKILLIALAVKTLFLFQDLLFLCQTKITYYIRVLCYEQNNIFQNIGNSTVKNFTQVIKHILVKPLDAFIIQSTNSIRANVGSFSKLFFIHFMFSE